MSADWIRSVLANAEETESFRSLLQEPRAYLLDAWEEIISFKDISNVKSDKTVVVARRIVDTYFRPISPKSIVSLCDKEAVATAVRQVDAAVDSADSADVASLKSTFDEILAQIEVDLAVSYRTRRSGANANTPLLIGSDKSKRSPNDYDSTYGGLTGAGWRNIIAWFLLGLINNFGYVVMLSAADDIGKPKVGPDNNNTACIHGTIPKGAILLADILPGLAVKVTAPFFVHLIPYWIRVIAVVLFSIGGFHLVGWPTTVAPQILGICLTSFASGLGETTFLSLSTFYHKNVISAWSSGTGGAGIFGSLFYLALTTWIGTTPFITLMICSFFPLIMLASYFFIMTPRQIAPGDTASSDDTSSGEDQSSSDGSATSKDNESVPLVDSDAEAGGSINREHTAAEFEALTFLTRLRLIVPLLIRYMIPLITVYYAEYLINQGVTPGLKFPGSFADNREYVYYQFLYQSGVFLSRSSVNLFQITFLWIFPILQVANFVLLFLQAIYHFIPTIWVVFGIILFEGLLGGGCYVNVYYALSSKEKKGPKKEFSMATVSMSDAFGISLAAATAIPVERFLLGPPPVCPPA